MMHAAVNCLVNDARRKSVCGVMGCMARRSVTPYPRRKAGLPSRTTSTAAPGALLDFRGAKMGSMRSEGTWAAAFMATEIESSEIAVHFRFNDPPDLSA